MKHLKQDIVSIFFVSFISSFFLFDFLLYIFLGENTPFVLLGVVTLILILFIYWVSLYLSRRIERDMLALKEYTKKISESKEYQASIKIENYFEFLESSIYLKNIAKRLSQKEKKTSKK
jgi:ABC-type multidrug transport system fused ATPase/permease subunit